MTKWGLILGMQVGLIFKKSSMSSMSSTLRGKPYDPFNSGRKSIWQKIQHLLLVYKTTTTTLSKQGREGNSSILERMSTKKTYS